MLYSVHRAFESIKVHKIIAVDSNSNKRYYDWMCHRRPTGNLQFDCRKNGVHWNNWINNADSGSCGSWFRHRKIVSVVYIALLALLASAQYLLYEKGKKKIFPDSTTCIAHTFVPYMHIARSIARTKVDKINNARIAYSVFSFVNLCKNVFNRTIRTLKSSSNSLFRVCGEFMAFVERLSENHESIGTKSANA